MRADYPDVDKYDTRPQRTPLEPGMYQLSLENVTDTKKDGSFLIDKNGKKYTLVTFRVDDHDDYLLFDRFNFDPTGEYYEINMSRFKQMLVALGAPTTGGQWAELIGRKCRAMVKVNGQYNNIHWYDIEDVPEQGEVQPLPKEEDLPY